jgi:RHH-type proline utilization regulon transcriptional repressor/proline dehydrogenase/delta 1-pyrroline-5-carboxylate dehydrogenase
MLKSIFSRRPAGSAAPSVARPGESLESRTLTLGRELLAAARANQSGFLTRLLSKDSLMNWAMKDPQFKVQMFRFVDAFPSLRDPEAIHEHLVDYLTQPGVTPPPGMSLGLAASGMAKGLLTKTMTSQIEGMAKNFIAGTDAASAIPTLRALWKKEIAFSVDLLGEACVSEAETDAYRKRYLDLIETLPAEVATWAPNPLLETDHLGPIPRNNVSIKLSALSVKTDPMDFDRSLQRTFESIKPILLAARKHNILVNFDMESFAHKDLTLALFMKCCEEIDFQAGMAMQAYLRSGDEDAQRIIDWSRKTGRVVTIRLVKGAYWDYESIHADQQGWPIPVWGSKPETDACFERMAQLFVSALPDSVGKGGTKLALGSHNLRSIAATLAMVEARGLPTSALELQMLHGMADDLKGVAVERRLRLREYVPVGEMIPGMAYLVRRLLENTSNESWLRAGFLDDASPDALLASPHDKASAAPSSPGALTNEDRLTALAEKHHLSTGLKGSHSFFTEPLRNFADAPQRTAFADAVNTASVQRVAIDATPADLERALATAHGAFPSWRAIPAAERAAALIRAAGLMRQRRDELSAIIVKENGKNWRNADADVCEAIDFCEYYAREAIPLFTHARLGRFTGELNETVYQPRGVCAVISPWNFPLAITCGMAVAALVTGNPVVLKPAEQTLGIAKILVDVLYESGIPKDVLHFLPGQGETIGAALVRDDRVKLIAFTGSRDVGLDILSAAAPKSPFQKPWTPPTDLKRVICEMGGKNAIIVDTSADLDEAVLGVRESAFGFSGQKCSACSRVIVLESCYDHFVERLVESAKTLSVGDPTDPGTDMGPVIDDDAANKITAAIELAKRESHLALATPPSPLGARYIGPHIFTDVQPTHRLATEEIFGPVLAVFKAKDFTHALELANASPYKLTGGVYSRKPSHLKQAKEDFRVGNLYLNRPITGALVARQPFGGFGMSGVGSKAGGKDYLLQFVEPRVITENTMRRGFAPDQ